MCVVDQSPRLDCSVQDSYGVQRSAANPERGSKHGSNQREVVALAGCAVDAHCAIGVPPCRLEVIEIHLGQREMCVMAFRSPPSSSSESPSINAAASSRFSWPIREAPDIAAPAA